MTREELEQALLEAEEEGIVEQFFGYEGEIRYRLTKCGTTISRALLEKFLRVERNLP